MLAVQDPPAEWVTVDELEALDVGRRNAIDVLKALEEHGVGEFRVGRKGHPSRLVWTTNPQQLVALVLSPGPGKANGSEPEPDESEVDEDGVDDDETDDDEADDDAEDDDETDEVEPARPQLALALQEELERRMSKLVAPASTPTKGRASARASTSHVAEPTPEVHAGDMTEHVYVLRPGMKVRVVLPTNLSTREAEVLGDWVRNLSFAR